MMNSYFDYQLLLSGMCKISPFMSNDEANLQLFIRNYFFLLLAVYFVTEV